MSHQPLGENAYPEASTWGIQFDLFQVRCATYHSRTEHITMTRLNPPMGFTSRGWSEEIGTDKPTPKTMSKSDEAALKEDPRLRGLIPIPVSVDGGKTLDWSRPVESENLAHPSVYSIVHR